MNRRVCTSLVPTIIGLWLVGTNNVHTLLALGKFYQAFALTHLAFGEFVAPALEGIVTGTEIYPHRCTP